MIKYFKNLVTETRGVDLLPTLGANQRAWGTEVPQRGPGAEPLVEVWGQSPQKHIHIMSFYSEFYAQNCNKLRHVYITQQL